MTPISLFQCPAELLFVPLIKGLVLFSKSEGKILKEQLWNLGAVFIFKLFWIIFKKKGLEKTMLSSESGRKSREMLFTSIYCTTAECNT